MKIATYNAASVRARLPRILEWLDENQPDLLAIQEIKVETDKFPYSDFLERGWQVEVHGQKAWNGVCFISKKPLTNVTKGMLTEECNVDARTISADFEGIRVINTYVPNGNKVGSEKWEYKMKWLDEFAELIAAQMTGQPLLWLGDINIAPQPHDVYNSAEVYGGVGHHPEEFSRLNRIVDHGLIDLFRIHNHGSDQFTFWDFVIPNGVARNIGWRIDHIYATEALAEQCQKCWIDFDARRLEKPSDHTFVVAEF